MCGTTRDMAKAVEQLEQVTIRFAGDSGDGMQLTGDRFTSETAVMGNDLSTLPDFPAEIRAPAGSLPGVSGFQLHFADHDILTPGDAPNVLVAMNPAALRTNVKRPAEGRHADRRHRHVQGAQPAEGRLRGEPARGRLARRLPRARGRADLDDGRRAEGDRGDHLARGRALEELLRARADELALQPAHRGDARVRREEVRASGPRSRRRTRPPSRPATRTARPRRTSRSATRSPRRRWRRASTGRSAATRRSPTG